VQPVAVTANIARIARRQHGLITAEQLGEAGLSRKQVQRWINHGRLDRALPGVVSLAGSAATREQRFMAAVLWGGPHALASHRCAAELWGFDGLTAAKPEITLAKATGKRSSRVVVHHTRWLTHGRRIRRGVPTTTPERTLIDLAASLRADQLEIAFESARRERLLTAVSVERALERVETRGRDGSRGLRQLLATLAAELPAESALEVLTARLLRETDLPKPQRQVEVTASGSRYRLDFAWPDERVALECDGREWHEMQFEHDRSRWSAITAETGYRIVWSTKGRLQKEPALIVNQLRELLCERVTGAPGT
jgi:very-short-patch-repair endonuclease